MLRVTQGFSACIRHGRGFALGLALGFAATAAHAVQVDIDGPDESDAFGAGIVVLPNGNFVVVDRSGGPANSGAVHLYAPDGARISSLYGSSTEDFIGIGGIEVLKSGDFVVFSPYWDNGPSDNAGAVTLVSGTSGLEGVISAANSLVGTHSGDQVGLEHVMLANGNYVVVSKNWTSEANGTFTTGVGAITFMRATQPFKGPVSAANSLVGTTKDDGLFIRLAELTNGHFVVSRPYADNGAVVDAGSITWVNGASGAVGPMTAANSLFGSQANDLVGLLATPLPNGRVAIGSAVFDNGTISNAGAVSLRSGNGPITGAITAANALMGAAANDTVGSGGVHAIGNGKLIVSTPTFDANGVANVGAVTVVPADAVLTGTVTTANSLTGSTANDEIGSAGITVLPSGNAVVQSPKWDSPVEFDVGAATWLDPIGLPGQTVSTGNSLYAEGLLDEFGRTVQVLANGNYVLACSYCNIGGATNSGAVVWASGTQRTSGPVTAANSVHGRSNEDFVGEVVTPLANGNYVIRSRLWNDRFNNLVNAGAATWVNGATGVARNEQSIGAEVSPQNSFVGSHAEDGVSSGAVTALANGNYVIGSPSFNFAPAFGITKSGAVTWGDGSVGLVGKPEFANSLFGTLKDDGVGSYVTPLPGGRFVVASPGYDGVVNGVTFTNVGAATWGSGVGPLTGFASNGTSLTPASGTNVFLGEVTVFPNGDYAVIAKSYAPNGLAKAGSVTFGRGSVGAYGYVDASNSVLGTVPNGGDQLRAAYNPKTDQMIVGQPAANRVTLFDETLFRSGFE